MLLFVDVCDVIVLLKSVFLVLICTIFSEKSASIEQAKKEPVAVATVKGFEKANTGLWAVVCEEAHREHRIEPGSTRDMLAAD